MSEKEEEEEEEVWKGKEKMGGINIVTLWVGVYTKECARLVKTTLYGLKEVDEVYVDLIQNKVTVHAYLYEEEVIAELREIGLKVVPWRFLHLQGGASTSNTKDE